MDRKKIKIGVIGLGYVGLPLAVELGRKFSTLGFDINEKRVHELCAGQDRTREVEQGVIRASKSLSFTTQIEDLSSCNVYIVTVPTPIDGNKLPDFTPLENASEMVGTVLSAGDTVIYESTVYPGATEEKCIPVLEKKSKLIFNQDFVVGYSPERINPG
ncbi:MAG: Vi polysaccharide biosynthesis protein VipA/TviB, partial [Verrucomicrobia bacterium]